MRLFEGECGIEEYIARRTAFIDEVDAMVINHSCSPEQAKDLIRAWIIAQKDGGKRWNEHSDRGGCK